MMINAQQHELAEIERIEDVYLCASTSIRRNRRQYENNTSVKSFHQNYSVCILYNSIQRFKIWEYEAIWTRPTYWLRRDHKKVDYSIFLSQIAQTELIYKSSQYKELNFKIKEYFMVPLLDKHFNISGLQLYINTKPSTSAPADNYRSSDQKVISLKQFSHKKGDYTFRNTTTKSGYKIYNRGLCDEFVLLTAKLSNTVVSKQDYFSNFEKE